MIQQMKLQKLLLMKHYITNHGASDPTEDVAETPVTPITSAGLIDPTPDVMFCS